MRRSGEQAAGSTTRTTTVHDRLRSEIIGGRLLPGTKLRIDDLRQRYEVGGTPVREALNRLAIEGLVNQVDQKGFHVKPISADELAELTRTRCWIAEIGLRESLANGDVAWEDGVVLAFHRLSRTPSRVDGGRALNPRWSELHRDFHASLLAACGSRWIVAFNDLLFDCAERYRCLLAAVDRQDRDIPGEHRAIMEAALARDAAAAAGLVAAHFSQTSERLLASLGAFVPDD